MTAYFTYSEPLNCDAHHVTVAGVLDVTVCGLPLTSLVHEVEAGYWEGSNPPADITCLTCRSRLN